MWKAPANVSVNAVIKPTIEFSNIEQDDMNVDPTAGKSVNAIRPFVGKGTLVWGARTLAGNDNEWRYVNVRRFFIFVEESVKKATEQFTFEPNDAQHLGEGPGDDRELPHDAVARRARCRASSPSTPSTWPSASARR